MNIEENTLISLFALYKETLGFSQDLEDSADFRRACQFIADQLENHFDWDTVAEVPNEELLSLLKKALKVEENGTKVSFDMLATRAALVASQQKFERAKTLYLAQDIEITGIQEKYLKSQLSAQEPLTVLDMQRFVLQTNMIGKINVVPLNALNIGLVLHQAKQNHSAAVTPYSVAMMINTGADAHNPAGNWLSLVVTIDPLSKGIKYEINAGYALTEEQKSKLEEDIQAAIQYQSDVDLSQTRYSAFPLRERSTLTGSITGSANAYNVLHQLYQKCNSLGISSEHADEFAQVLNNPLSGIKQYVYKKQLSAIKLRPDELELIAHQERFELGRIKQEALVQQFELLAKPKAPPVAHQHLLVTERLSELQLYHKKINFPGEVPETPLSSGDYQQFLMAVQGKFKGAGIDKVLDELVISCYDSTALIGLIAYNETRLPLPLTALTLDLSSLDLSIDTARKAFLFNFKTMLLTMSENNLAALHIVDPSDQLKAGDIAELASFIKARSVAIDISLPATYQTTVAQKEIDDATSDNIRAKNSASLNKKIVDTDVSVQQRVEVRKRPKSKGKQAVVVDIELQQEQQVEVAVEAGNEVQAGDEIPVAGELVLYNMEQFADAIATGLLSKSAKSYLIDSSRENACELWCTWTGAFSNIDATIQDLKISKAACEELVRHHDKFQYGLDIQKLPPGFVMHGRPAFIHYDENLKLIADYDGARIQTTELPGPKALTSMQMQQWLACTDDSNPIKRAWIDLNKAPYDKQAHHLFKVFLPAMVLLKNEDLERLFELSLNETGTLNKDRFQFLLEDRNKLQKLLKTSYNDNNLHETLKILFGEDTLKAKTFLHEATETPSSNVTNHLLGQLIGDNEGLREKIVELCKLDIHLNQLLQLYIEFGEKGIDLLKARIEQHPELFAELNQHVFSNTTSYAPVLTDDFESAIQAIQGFSPEQRTWWNTLLSQHAAAQSNVNIVDLVNAFKNFNIKLAHLSLGKGALVLPNTCELTDVTSLPVALSRIMTLMEHSSPVNRAAQLTQIGTLDLSSTGMIKAITHQEMGKTWAFVVPEMHITKSENDLAIGSYKAIPRWKDLATAHSKNLVKNFFRFASYGKKEAQLPLEFYQHVNQKLKESRLSAVELCLLYPMIAASSVGEQNISRVQSLEHAKEDINTLITLIKEKPSGVLEVVRTNVRMNVLHSLFGLEIIPPLPVLIRLMTVIYSGLDGMIDILKNQERLQQANAALRDSVSAYGSSVYDGLKDYTDNDYSKKKLFFNHMDVVSKIKNSFDQTHFNDALSLISLISSFKIGVNDIDGLVGEYFMEHKKRQRHETLFLLQKLSVIDSGKRLLSVNDLKAILKAVNETPSDQSIVDVIANLKLEGDVALADYFPKDYLENYVKKGVDEQVQQLIAQHFTVHQQQHINKVLLSFGANGDAAEYQKIVEKIIKISAPLGPLEKNIFIIKLSSSKGLYTEPKRLDAEDNAFVHVLDAMIERRSPDDFLNFIAAERTLARDMPKEQESEFFVSSNDSLVMNNLSDKASLYLRVILPAFKTINNLALSQLDITPRVLATLLRTPPDQLSKPSALVSDKIDYFIQQKSALEAIHKAIIGAKSVDLVEAQDTNNEFIKNATLEDSTPFDNFKESLASKEGSKKITQEERQDIETNPPIILMIAYLSDTMTSDQRELFEQRYQEKLTQKVQAYPSIMKNKDLIKFLFANPDMMSSLVEPQSKAALSNPLLLDGNDAGLECVFAALDHDLNIVAKFKSEVEDLQKVVETETIALNAYPNVFTELFKKINAVVTGNPSSKKQFLDLFDRFLEQYSPSKHGELLKYQSDFVNTLAKSFSKMEDKNIVLALCLQFNSDSNGGLQPQDLLALLQEVDALPQERQAIMLKIAVALINNDKSYSIEWIKTLSKAMNENPLLVPVLESMYKTAPFPTIKNVLAWHQGAITQPAPDYANAMKAYYDAFDKQPCLRAKTNGFDPNKAQEQLKKFKGFDENLIDVNAFAAKTLEMRDKTSRELLDIFATFNPNHAHYNPAVDYDTLVAVAAELLHRSKGRDGSSMELNTTQYLAILSALKTEGHVTCQIRTGEGKSRIMMILIACQFALGKTVDFVTSDAQLATRDYVEFQAYFEMLGAQTSMIYAHTDPSLYRKRGINFSDPTNFSLFLNKALSMGLGHLVQDERAEFRALLLDEADKTYFDVADTRFNFSTEGDDSIRDMEWVYPLLMEYFAQEHVNLAPLWNGRAEVSPLELYYDDIDLSREKFLQFASGKCPKDQLMRLKALPNSQIEQWQVSAVTARQLKFQEDFIIEPDVLINTATGPKISSEVRLLFANRVSSAKYSFGVHQCLVALLNSARSNLDAEPNEKLKDALAKCEQPFYVQGEKQIVYSSTSKNLLDDYEYGTLHAVTGTSGSNIEREEARALYGLHGSTMHFIDVPRDKGLNRIDKSIRLAGDQAQQLDVLVEQIKEARAKNQPILIIAENDNESEFLFKKLSERFKNDLGMQHIHNRLSLKDERDCIGRAGVPGQITVSTDMIGRGTDISLQEAAKTHGLNVMLTYLPGQRTLEQVIGRSGRFGAKGTSSIVLDKERLKQALGKTTLTDGFYTHAESYLARELALIDRNKQAERIIKNTVGDFKKQLTDNFFKDMLTHASDEQVRKLLPLWTDFFNKSDKVWNEQWPWIQKELSGEHIDISAVNTLLDQYKHNVQKSWNILRRNALDLNVPQAEQLSVTLPALQVSPVTEKLLQQFDIRTYKLATSVYDQYYRGHDGRAVTYSHWSIPVIASLKGFANLLPGVNFANARPPFANTRAWFEGRGQLFADFRASKNKGKILGSLLLGVALAGLGVALILTGVFAPLGVGLVVTSVIAGAVGAVVGPSVGLAGGAVVDALNAKVPPEEEHVKEEKPEQSHHSVGQQQEAVLVQEPHNSYSKVMSHNTNKVKSKDASDKQVNKVEGPVPAEQQQPLTKKTLQDVVGSYPTPKQRNDINSGLG